MYLTTDARSQWAPDGKVSLNPTRLPDASKDRSGRLGMRIWACEPAALQRILDLENKAREDGLTLYAAKKRPLQAVMREAVAEVPVRGVLVKAAEWWYDVFGVEYTETPELARVVRELADDESVSKIVLRIESPGGEVAGTKEAADAIFAARQIKPVEAFIEDLGASGAYYVASQANRIEANDNAVVGSIGVYTLLVDTSKAFGEAGIRVIRVRSGPEKGTEAPGQEIPDDALAPYQELVDAMAAQFVADVARGRGKSASVVEQWATGRFWRAPEAPRGLIDAVRSWDSYRNSSAAVPAVSIDIRKEPKMAEQEKPAVDENALRKQAAEEARNEERQRLADLRAAFQGDPDFALEQSEKGASVAEAKAAYCDVLMGRLAEAEDRIEQLSAERAAAQKAPQGSAQAQQPQGAETVEFAEGRPEANDGDAFRARARAYARENQCGMVEAMRAVRKEMKGAHDAYRGRAPEQPLRK